MTDLIGLLHHYLRESEGAKTEPKEYLAQSDMTDELYDELAESLNKEQKEKLRRLDDEYLKLNSMDCDESFAFGFKTAVRLLLQVLE